MKQAEKIIQQAKATGNDIRWVFQDKKFVLVGDVMYSRVRAVAFHDACRAAGLKCEVLGKGFGWWKV
jgi:hypothetical protein